MHRANPAGTLTRACVLGGLLALAGCTSPPKTLYHWGSYQASLYSYFKGNGADPGAMIAQLEEQLQQTLAKGGVPPPGLHGHLALLYTKVGDDASAAAHLYAERKLFMESAPYMDMLLQRAPAPPAGAASAASATPTRPASAART